MYLTKENHNNKSRKYHLNLYHLSEDGKETMMTIDHIIPKSKGGVNKISNLQTMCYDCNFAKGNTIPEEIV
jgi:5-methylcytosine-specific restriction enzyme A